jgi:putative nucleotidyltransferase with HDIG domain
MSQKILVVESDDKIRNFVVSALSSAGFDSYEATDDVAAFALLDSSSEFEAVLTSVPKLSGLKLLERVRLNSRKLDGFRLLENVKSKYPDVPVIILADRSQSAALLATRNGAYGYLPKSFDREDLLNVVRRALENRRLKLENRAYQANVETLVSARTEQLRQAVTTLERSYDITLEALGNALDLKEAETEGHSKRVTAFTIAISRAMAIPAEQIRVIARGAFLHDIGKMAIPDSILRKPGSLNAEETAIMREHCFRGYQILQRIPFLAEPAEIVYCHHENYDGSGYPRALHGDQIPLAARIVAVANTLDAMTSDRPYRAACSFGAAIEEIQRWSGRQFDPNVVQVFSQMGESLWPQLRENMRRAPR